TFEESNLNGTLRTFIKTELRHMFTEQIALTGFMDSGTVFLSREQKKKFDEAYSNPVTLCAGTDAQTEAYRTIENNIEYNYSELKDSPRQLWDRHYFSYGASVNFLTAIGSINLAYGLPWREPKTDACVDDKSQ